MRGHEVAHEEEDVHHDVLRDGDDVRARDLEHLDVALNGRVEVDVVRADAGCDADLEVLRLGDELAREIARVEGRGDEDLGVLDVLLEDAVRAFLVVGNLVEEGYEWIVLHGPRRREEGAQCTHDLETRATGGYRVGSRWYQEGGALAWPPHHPCKGQQGPRGFSMSTTVAIKSTPITHLHAAVRDMGSGGGSNAALKCSGGGVEERHVGQWT